MKVLIVDDNKPLAECVGEILASRGAEVFLAFDGKEAMKLISEHSFDAGVIDQRLPFCSGLDLVPLLRKQPNCDTTIVITGEVTSNMERRATAAGASALLMKPFSPTQVLKLLGLGLESVNNVGSALGGARVAHLGRPKEIDEVAALGDVQVDHFSTEQDLTQALSSGGYDVVVLSLEFYNPQLAEDIKSLDGELAVVASSSAELVAAGIRRSNARRERSRDLVTLQRVFERADVAMLVVDGTPPVVHAWNSAVLELLEHPPSTLAGAPISTLEGGVQSGRLSEMVAAARAGEGAASSTVQLRLTRGRVQSVVVSVQSLGLGDRVCLTLVSESKASSAALALLGATAAGVAHEMRNTFAAVTSSLSVVAGRMVPQSEEVRVITQVLSRISRASEVLSDLLVFARPTAPQFRVVPARLVLAAVVEEVAMEAGEGVQVRYECPDSTLNIVVDPDLLQMALVNLALNSVQAIEGTGEVVLAAAIRGDQLEIRIEDTGPGIPPEIKGEAFTPFVTSRAEGSGLGLANVRKIIESLNGVVELLKDTPKTTFVCLLPQRPTEEDGI